MLAIAKNCLDERHWKICDGELIIMMAEKKYSNIQECWNLALYAFSVCKIILKMDYE